MESYNLVQQEIKNVWENNICFQLSLTLNQCQKKSKNSLPEWRQSINQSMNLNPR